MPMLSASRPFLGKKTDIMDCKRIAKLLRYGLLPNSFIPPREIRELRDLNRTLKKAGWNDDLREESTDKSVRIIEYRFPARLYPEDLWRFINGYDSISSERIGFPKRKSQLAKGSLKKKADLLEKALDGKLTDHHRFLLKCIWRISIILPGKSQKSMNRSREMIPFQKESNLIQSIPGISKVSAFAILAEIGTDMSQFPGRSTSFFLAGVCPGTMKVLARKRAEKPKKEILFERNVG